jgi:predicted nucleic acid-binding protein
MNEELKSLYIETTIPSYVTARESSKLLTATRQLLTKRFWEEERHHYRLYTSQYTIEECADGDPEAAKRRLDFLSKITVLPKTEEIANLAKTYFEILSIPERAKTDCFHIATCVVNEINYLLSWNFTHLGFDTYIKVVNYNTKRELWTPVLITPDYLLNFTDEEGGAL